MVIRQGRQEELSELARLYLRAYRGLEEYGEPDLQAAENYLGWLFSTCPEGFLVVEVGKKPAGFLACCPDWRPGGGRERVLEIHELVVDPDFRGQGLARALLERAFELGRARGRKKACLWVGEGNRQARELYRRLGFQEQGRWGKWIRMVRGLPPAPNRLL